MKKRQKNAVFAPLSISMSFMHNVICTLPLHGHFVFQFRNVGINFKILLIIIIKLYVTYIYLSYNVSF